MNGRLALLTGGLAVGLAALWRIVRRQPREGPAEQPPDPRADELRARLDESRPVVDDRDEFEGAETTVDAADVAPDPDERRRAVHTEGRSVVDRMRDPSE